MTKFRTKVLEVADRSPVEVDEPGCVPVENALLELSAVKNLISYETFESWQRKSVELMKMNNNIQCYPARP